MNDDDYNFESTENCRLSDLFRKDYEASNSSLMYQAPKQPSGPSASVPATNYKTFHKYIHLYENDYGKLFGKYVIALVSSNVNSAEILIYQTKKHIFIRCPIHKRQLFAYTNQYTLILNEKLQQFRLEFENDIELLEFTSEYAKHGGLIEVLEGSVNYDENQSVSLNITQETGSSNLPGSVADSINNKNEKSNILNRLEKIGVSLPFETMENNMNSAKRDGAPNKDHTSHEVGFETCAEKFSDTLNMLSNTKKNYAKIGTSKLANSNEGIELLTSLLIDNQTNNSELKKAIYLLISRLKEILLIDHDDDENKSKKLESKIKTLELKLENLQSELPKFDNKCENQNYSHLKLPIKHKKDVRDAACQKDNFEYDSKETNNLTSLLLQTLNIVRSLSLTTDDIAKLEELKDGIQDPHLMTIVEPHFKFTEGKTKIEAITGNEALRNEFLCALKEIMNDMYQNICTSEPNPDVKSLLAKQIKHASFEILKIYDNSIQHKQREN